MRNFKVDGNFSSLTPPTSGDYDQRAALKCQISPTGNRNHLRTLRFENIYFTDRVAAGIQIGPSTTTAVDPTQANLDGGAGNNTTGLIGEAYVHNIFGEKHDTARSLVSHGSGVGRIYMENITATDAGGAQVNDIQCEFTGTPPDLTIESNIRHCHLGGLDIVGDAGNDDQLVVRVSKSTFYSRVNFNRCIATVDECRLWFTADRSWLAHDVEVRDSYIYHTVTGGEIAELSVQDNGGANDIRFSRVRFIIDDVAASFPSATNPLVNLNNKTDVTNYYAEFDRCWFDPRARNSIDGYAGGHFVTRGCTFGSTDNTKGGVQVGSFSSNVSQWEDYDSDFTACGVPFKVQGTVIGGTDIELHGGRYNDFNWSESGANDWTESFNKCTRVLHVTAKPSGGGVMGDTAILIQANYVPGGPRGWSCIATHNSAATWIPFGWEATSAANDPTTAEYPNDGDFHPHHNTSSGNRFLAWNQGGTVYKVQVT